MNFLSRGLAASIALCAFLVSPVLGANDQSTDNIDLGEKIRERIKSDRALFDHVMEEVWGLSSKTELDHAWQYRKDWLHFDVSFEGQVELKDFKVADTLPEKRVLVYSDVLDGCNLSSGDSGVAVGHDYEIKTEKSSQIDRSSQIETGLGLEASVSIGADVAGIGSASVSAGVTWNQTVTLNHTISKTKTTTSTHTYHWNKTLEAGSWFRTKFFADVVDAEAAPFTGEYHISGDVRIGAAPRVCLYQDKNFSGKDHCFHEDTKYIGDHFNDNVMSIEFLRSAWVNLYEDRNYHGAKKKFQTQDKDMSNNGEYLGTGQWWNKNLSSVGVSDHEKVLTIDRSNSVWDFISTLPAQGTVDVSRSNNIRQLFDSGECGPDDDPAPESVDASESHHVRVSSDQDDE